MIYSSRDEIEVMRLVGASNWFIRGPFFMQGIIAGVLATGIVLFLLFPITFVFQGQIQSLLGGFNLFQYFLSHFFLLLFLQLFAGVALGVISSGIAIRRHLKV
jgi:cell division transport system permease protein